MKNWNVFDDKVTKDWFPDHDIMVLVSKDNDVFCAKLLSGINGYWWADINDRFITNFEGTKGWMPYPSASNIEYKANIHRERQSEESFCVCLMATPKFPNDNPLHCKLDSPPVAVVGATDRGGEWSFVSLNINEKECIGNELVLAGALDGVWLWCDLFEVSV